MHCTARHWTLPHGSFELPFTSPKTQTRVTENQAKPRRQEAESQPHGSLGNIPTCALQWAAGCGLISFYPWLTFSLTSFPAQRNIPGSTEGSRNIQKHQQSAKVGTRAQRPLSVDTPSALLWQQFQNPWALATAQTEVTLHHWEC